MSSQLRQEDGPDAPSMDVGAEAAPRPASGSSAARKAPGAFRTISEVAEELNVQQHVLRFWETKFTQVKPLKRGGGRRYYRPEDVALLKRIHHLLYSEGYTIKGVQKLIRGQGRQQLAQQQDVDEADAAEHEASPDREADSAVTEESAEERPESPKPSEKQRQILEAMLGELKELREMIRSSGGGDVLN